MSIKKVVALMLLFSFTSAYADIETDKNAGICALYMSLRGKNSGSEVAIKLADNQSRAYIFAKEWANANKSANGLMALEGDSACKKIGLRPSQY